MARPCGRSSWAWPWCWLLSCSGASPPGSGSGCEFFESHLQDGIVVAEEDERNLRRLADAANEIHNPGESRARFQGTLGSSLNRGAIGEGITERHAELDNISARRCESEDKFQCSVERRIACRDVGDDAEFADFAQRFKPFVDSRFQE